MGQVNIHIHEHKNFSQNQRDEDNPDILKLSNVTIEDEGWYTCMAANSLGLSMASGYLQVLEGNFNTVSVHRIFNTERFYLFQSSQLQNQFRLNRGGSTLWPLCLARFSLWPF
jgi:Immunoglobulin I-set domain